MIITCRPMLVDFFETEEIHSKDWRYMTKLTTTYKINCTCSVIVENVCNIVLNR